MSLVGRSLSASLTVKDLEASLAWYRDLLGFEVDTNHGRAISLRAGEVRVLVVQDNFAKGTERLKGEGFSLRITTDQDIDTIAGRIKEGGVTLDTEPFEMGGARAFRVRDPDGFLWVISSVPKSSERG